MKARVSTPENNRFLDQFRYSIIASQLLTYEAKPTAETEVAHTLGDHAAEFHHATNSFSLQGAAVSATISFLTAWTLNWARALSPESATHWLNLCVTLALLAGMAVVMYAYARRKSVQRVRHAAVEALSDLIMQSHALDSVGRSALGLIQEIEIVSRGYEM
jgi:Mysoin-binding motif of peroxisomes